MSPLGKILIVSGIVLTLVGILMLLTPKIPLLGKLPGDIFIKRENFSLYFPIASSIALSVIITIILNIMMRNK